jgi:hypothetical protein
MSSEPLASETPAVLRRHDLDWIRVCAFMLLILYHVGMFYVPWDWHVNSPRPVEWLEPVMQLTNPWRLTLFLLAFICTIIFMFPIVSSFLFRHPMFLKTIGFSR